jgi:hypothetical protein
MGYNDGSSLTTWVNYVNDTYSEVNALIVIEPLQIAVFPSTEPLTGCAVRGNRVTTLSGSEVALFTTANPNVPITRQKVACTLFIWTGSFLGAEHLFHLGFPVCNCIDKTTKPCPPTMEIVATGNDLAVAEELEKFRTTYYPGRNFTEAYNTPHLTKWPDVTVPVAFVDNWNETSGTADNIVYKKLCNNLKTNKTDPNLYKDQIVVIHHVFDSGCPEYKTHDLLIAHGAAGLIKGLFPATIVTAFALPNFDHVYLSLIHEDWIEMRRIWYATVPLPVSPVSPPEIFTPRSPAVVVLPQFVAVVVAVIVALVRFF